MASKAVTNHTLRMIICNTSCPIDKYSICQTASFQVAGKQLGLHLRNDDIVEFLGKPKRIHIQEMMKQRHLLEQFHLKHHRHFDHNRDVAYFYDLYLQTQLSLLQQIPLFSELLTDFQTMQKLLELSHSQVLYGITSTYPLQIMKFLMQRFKTQGFVPDVMRCASHATTTRDMIQLCLQQHGIEAKNAVFVSDQQMDIDAANACRMFVIGVTHSGEKFKSTNAVCADMKEVGYLLSSF